jgi:UDP-glucose 4-epimerase
MRCIALRYGNPYGKGQYGSARFGVIAAFLRAAAMNRPLQVWGDGSIVRDFVYIDDAVDATLGAFQYNGPLRTFNIGSGVGTSVNDIVRAVKEVTNLH